MSDRAHVPQKTNECLDQGRARSADAMSRTPPFPLMGARVGATGVLRLAMAAGNRAVVHALQRHAENSSATVAVGPVMWSGSDRTVVARDNEGVGTVNLPADAGVDDARDAGVARIEGYTLSTDPRAQRRQMEQLVVDRGRNGPRDYLDGVEMAVLRMTPVAGMAENQSQLEEAQSALAALRMVVSAVETDIDSQIVSFTSDGREILEGVLTDSETRAKGEAIKYGLTEEQVEELVCVDPMSGSTEGQSWTKYDMPGSAAASGMAAAATQLLQRRNDKITPLKTKLLELNTRWASAYPQGGGPYIPPKPTGLEETEAALKEEEQEYDGLAADLTARYPILGSFTKDKDDTGGLQRLSVGPSQETAQLIGTQIAGTLSKIKRVRDENVPDGDVNIYKLGKIVALTKARQSIVGGSWQEKIIEERVAHATETSILVDLALGLLNMAMIALAPATGGASLIVAAGLSTAAAVVHAQEYMLEDAMAGSDVDKARAISQEDPSLFWLAVDIVGAVGDVGAGASAAAKLLGVWKSAAPAVRAIKAANTVDEVAAARRLLTTMLDEQPKVLARVTKSLDEGRLTGTSKELAAVEKAAGGTPADLKAGHQTTMGMRARYSEVLASSEGKGMFDSLTQIEEDAAKVAPGDAAGLRELARRATALDLELARVALRARAEKIAAWLPTMAEAYPALKDNPLGVEAILRIISKSNPDHVKGQLLEELAGSRIKRMIAAGDKTGLATLAGERANATLEYIHGHRIQDARGKQFTDGMLIVRHGQKVEEGKKVEIIEIVAIFESKAGKAASTGLGAEYSSLRVDGSYKSLEELGDGRPFEKLPDETRALFEARQEAISDLRAGDRKKYGKRTIEQIDRDPAAQGDIARVMDKMVKTEAGQAVQDIERAVSLGLTIDDDAVAVSRAGRSSTKVVGVLPTDVNAAAIEAKIGGVPDPKKPSGKKDERGQGLNFGTMNVGMSSKDLSELATAIAVRAAAPTH